MWRRRCVEPSLCSWCLLLYCALSYFGLALCGSPRDPTLSSAAVRTAPLHGVPYHLDIPDCLATAAAAWVGVVCLFSAGVNFKRKQFLVLEENQNVPLSLWNHHSDQGKAEPLTWFWETELWPGAAALRPPGSACLTSVRGQAVLRLLQQCHSARLPGDRWRFSLGFLSRELDRNKAQTRLNIFF